MKRNSYTSLFILTLLGGLFIISCRKYDVAKKPGSDPFIAQFFKLPDNAGVELKKIVSIIKEQENKYNFLSRVIKRNGLPVWENVLSNLTSTQTQQYKSGSAINDSIIFYIPFQSTSSSEITSYLVCLQVDTNYNFRFYQKNVLDTIVTSDENRKIFLKSALSVFALFEKQINQKDSLLILGIYNKYFSEASLTFSNNIHGGRNSYSNIAAVEIRTCYTIECPQLAFKNNSLGVCFECHSSWIIDWGQSIVALEWPDLGGGNGSGSGGGPPPPPPPPPTDPCATANNAANKMDSLYLKSKADSVLGTISNLSTYPLEKGFAMIKKKSVDPYNPLIVLNYHSYRCDIVNTGDSTSVTINYILGYLEEFAGALHTHPPKGYAGPSTNDIYILIQERQQNIHLDGNIIAAANGSQYAITVSDSAKAAAFLSTQNQYLNTVTKGWNETSTIGKAFKDAENHFLKVYKNSTYKENFAFEMAMAVVLNQFDTGVTLHKKNAAGNFKPLLVTTTIPDPNKPKKKVYTQDCL